MGTAATIINRAVAETGFEDFGSTHVFDAIDCWSADLASPRLSDSGRVFLERLIVRNLVLRLRINDLLAAHPEIAETPLPPVVLIVGFARSGTTLLHQLVGCHPQARPMLRWELVAPLPPPEATTWADDPRIAQVQAAMEPLRGTLLERTHWVNADEPEECPWGFYDGRGLLGRGCVGVMRTWAEHVVFTDHRPTFAEYRRLLQILLWRNPPAAGSVLVLKSPTSGSHLEAFRDMFPEARFVFTHRDPVRTLVSATTVVGHICQSFTLTGSDPLADDGRTDRFMLRVQGAVADGLRAFAGAHPERVTHVAYPALMADPVRVTSEVLHAIGMDDPGRATPGVVDLLDRQRAGHRASPPGAYADHGYQPDQIRDDPAASAYCEAFGVEPEPTRLVETAPIAS